MITLESLGNWINSNLSGIEAKFNSPFRNSLWFFIDGECFGWIDKDWMLNTGYYKCSIRLVDEAETDCDFDDLTEKDVARLIFDEILRGNDECMAQLRSVSECIGAAEIAMGLT